MHPSHPENDRQCPPCVLLTTNTDQCRANEVTALGGKRTIMPADVFRALDEIELGFMRERVEAEFASPSTSISYLLTAPNPQELEKADKR